MPQLQSPLLPCFLVFPLLPQVSLVVATVHREVVSEQSVPSATYPPLLRGVPAVAATLFLVLPQLPLLPQ